MNHWSIAAISQGATIFKIINDSKSTSYASPIPLLENQNKIFWILGGTAKKGDKFFVK